MVTAHTRSGRQGNFRKKITLFFVALLGFATVVTSCVIFLKSGEMRQTNILVVGDPMFLVIADSGSEKFTVLKIPADVQIEGVYGVGRYSLRSLWNLGLLSKKSHDLLTKSLSEALAVPVELYINPAGRTVEATASEIETLKGAFSFRTIFSFMHSGVSTNIPAFTSVQLAWFFRSTGIDRLQTIDMGESTAISTERLPDNAEVPVFDPNGFDATIELAFETRAIRKEALSITIYNTTEVPLLGQRVSRLLGHIGAHVVSIKNDVTPRVKCEVRGSETALKSKTAQLITSYYHCDAALLSEQGEEDLEFRIGHDYRAMFLPKSGGN